ncbi:MAG TPA: hypothetical protein VKA83_01510 [Methylomirabilota bacterium]|nr:hypothetical protein [Methylomirabilota bacterium]
MGLIEFFVVVIVCCLLAWLVCYVLSHFMPGTPAFVPMVVWGVAVLLILVTLLKALGLWGIDPQIPRLR